MLGDEGPRSERLELRYPSLRSSAIGGQHGVAGNVQLSRKLAAGRQTLIYSQAPIQNSAPDAVINLIRQVLAALDEQAQLHGRPSA